jgi:hypothetical protein
VRTNTLFVLTGNNLVVKGDARRRGLMWRLNAKVDRPDERKFDVDLKEWVPKNRGRLVHAGLTLMAGYYAARRAAPDGKLFRDRVGKEPDAFGEYREWSASVRGTLLWLAMSDPVASQEEVFKREPEGQELSAFIMAVAGHSNLVGIEWTAAELLSLIGDPGDNSKAVLDALQAALPGNVTARTVGHFLLKYMGRPIGGRCIKRGTKDTHTDAYQWSVGLVELDLVGGSI